MKTLLIALLLPFSLYADPFNNRPMPGVEWKIERPTGLERRLNAEADLLELQYSRELFRGIMPGTRAEDIGNPIYKNMPNSDLNDLIIILQSQEESPETPALDLRRVFPIGTLR